MYRLAAASSVGVLEEKELELRTDLHLEAQRGRARDLRAQDLAGRYLDGFAGCFVGEVTQDECGLVEPRDAPEGVEIGHAPEVAVALLPVGVLVPGEWRHVDVEREEVVARFDRATTVEDVLQEVVADDPLAHEAALEIGEAHDHRVDLTGDDEVAQCGRREVS